MRSSKPYLIRALFDWIVDSDCTPHIVVNAVEEDVSVPAQYVKDGQIVLNISPFAVLDLLMKDESISFNARFGGVSTLVYVPMTAVLGIYARENGSGMMFDQSDEFDPAPPPASPVQSTSRPALKLIK